MRRLTVILATIAAFAGIAAASPASPASPAHPARPAALRAGSRTALAHPAAAPACRTGLMTIWFDNRLNGTAGTFFYGLKFTNLSGNPCTLRGYPGVSAVDVNGHRVGRPASRFTGHPIHTIMLLAGQTATASVGIVDVGAVPPSSCHAVTAAGFRVYPPGQRSSRVVPFPFRTCSAGFTSLRILPVTH